MLVHPGVPHGPTTLEIRFKMAIPGQVRDIAHVTVKMGTSTSILLAPPVCNKHYFARILRAPRYWTGSFSEFEDSDNGVFPLVPEAEDIVTQVGASANLPKYYFSGAYLTQQWPHFVRRARYIPDAVYVRRYKLENDGEAPEDAPQEVLDAVEQLDAHEWLPGFMTLGPYTILRPRLLKCDMNLVIDEQQNDYTINFNSWYRIWHINTSAVGNSAQLTANSLGSIGVLALLDSKSKPLGVNQPVGFSVTVEPKADGALFPAIEAGLGLSAWEEALGGTHFVILQLGGGKYDVVLNFTNKTVSWYSNQIDPEAGLQRLGVEPFPILGERGKPLDIFVYPVGKHLFVFAHSSTDQGGAKREVVSFQFDKPIKYSGAFSYAVALPSGSVFEDAMVFHEPAGLIVIPKTYFNQEAQEDFRQMYYEGKVEGDNQDSTLTFPRPNDTSGLFDHFRPPGNYPSSPTIESFHYYWRDPSLPYNDSGEFPVMAVGMGIFVTASGDYATTQDLIDINEDADYDKEQALKANTIILQKFAYSPALVFGRQIVEFARRSITLTDTPVLEDVLNVTVNRTPEGGTASVILNNRKHWRQDSSGSYTIPSAGGIYTSDVRIRGVKPCRIYGYWWDEVLDPGGFAPDSLPIFTGYVVNRDFSRGPSPESTVSLSLEDAGLPLRDTMSFALPVFDGWCHLAVIYYLAKYAGFTDDQILWMQNPIDETDKIRLSEVMTAGGTDVNNYIGGCWDGHILGFPAGDYGGVPSTKVHHVMAHSHDRMNPSFKPEKGTYIWDTMQTVRQETLWMLYINNWGNLVYQPLEVAWNQLRVDGVTLDPIFREVPSSFTTFDEIIRSATINYPTTDVRNVVTTWGLVLRGEDESGRPQLAPLVEHTVEPGWPDNVDSETYIPWKRMAVTINPMWNDRARLAEAHQQMFLRANRVRRVARFGAWGRVEIAPYVCLGILEKPTFELSPEREENLVTYIVTNVNHTFDENRHWTVQIEGELLGADPGLLVEAVDIRKQDIGDTGVEVYVDLSNPEKRRSVGSGKVVYDPES